MDRARRPEALRFDFDASDVADEVAPVEPASNGAGADSGAESPSATLRELPPGAESPSATLRELPSAAMRPVPMRVPRDQAQPVSPSDDRLPPPAAATSDTALSVAQFYDRVRAALSHALPGEVWVTGEIGSVKESKGHRFIELADHDESGTRRPSQQLEVVCWSREWQRIGAELARAGVSLEAGRVVRVRGKVGVWEGAGKLRLQMTALDVEALLGGIAVARQRLLRQLGEEGLLEANRRLALSPVPLRVGLVTSQGSEAHRDFAGRLERSGFAFELRVERSLVQGTQAPWQIAGALRRLGRAELDLIVVVRGGGARGDLAAFDSEPVARAIAGAAVPVWVGIGHTGDRSVADEVAHQSFITPTACGEALVAWVEAYWSRVLGCAATLASRASSRLTVAAERLGRTRTMVSHHVRHQLLRRSDALAERCDQLQSATSRLIESEALQLVLLADRLARCGRDAALEEAHGVRRCREVLRAYDPQRQLERGWSLTRDEAGRLVRSVADLSDGELVRTTLADGELRARVEGSFPTAQPAAAGSTAPAVSR